MKVKVFKNSLQLGVDAASYCAEILNKAIEEQGKARIILSTGASQFDTMSSLVQKDINWSKVEMFHLDEYINLSESHPASFRKYLKERFVSKVNLKKVYLINGEGDLDSNIRELTRELLKEPIDLGLIGIGENAHIAFNDPPADFDTEEAFIIVKLDEACKKQQVGEGWFPCIKDVPEKAITMTVHQIMKCKAIVSCVPYKAKAYAIKLMLENDVTNEIPATILKKHGNITLYIDEDSASLVNRDILNKYL